MRHDDGHGGKIHGDIIYRHRVTILQTHTAARHTRAEAAVAGMKDDRKTGFRENLIERVNERLRIRDGQAAMRQDQPMAYPDHGSIRNHKAR
jgi:mRNA-degrading endonuclease toxin of MazEF toxin-antitoxin module